MSGYFLPLLHRLSRLICRAIYYDSCEHAANELLSNLVSLCLQANRVAFREYELLEVKLLTNYAIWQSNLCNQSPNTESTGLTNSYSSICDYFGYPSRFVSYANVNKCSPYSASFSQLGFLRGLCENLRQGLSQANSLTNQLEQSFYQMRHLLRADSIFQPYIMISSRRLIEDSVVPLVTAALTAAHHLVHSGLNLLAHTDLTQYTHEELWEMARGMEELGILGTRLQVSQQNRRHQSIKSLLYESLISKGHKSEEQTKSTGKILALIEASGLFVDPAFSIGSISVGRIFYFLANQRSFATARSIRHKLLHSPVCISYINQGSRQLNDAEALCTSFVKYLQDSDGMLLEDFLRGEYEFSSGFLDILSQSTEMLRQIQKLQLASNATMAEEALIASQLPTYRIHKQSQKPHHHSNNQQRLNTANENVSKSCFDETLKFELDFCHDPNKESLLNARRRHQQLLSKAGTLDRYVAMATKQNSPPNAEP
ncbi:unnamed protein product, partial [Protopolystoma xenopodis]